MHKHIYDDNEPGQDYHDPKSEESQQVLAEIISSCNKRWVDYEED